MSSPVTTPERGTGRFGGPWTTFGVCATATYIGSLDFSIVNVAFIEIERAFTGASRASVSWVVTAYAILYGSLLVVSGRAADRIGRKRVFGFGVRMFLLGSVVCALAPTIVVLVAGRIVQGAGAAMLTPSALGMMISAFPVERRNQMVSWNTAISALGVASGPTLGAVLIGVLDWRAAFWVNIPICLAVLVLVRRVDAPAPTERGALPDVPAAVFVTFAVGALVWGIAETEVVGIADVRVWGALLVASGLGAVVVHRTRTRPEPLLPRVMFAHRSMNLANVAMILFGGAFSGNILNNVLFMRTEWEFGIVRAGLFSVLSPVTVAITSFLVGRNVRRLGLRNLLIVGSGLFMVCQLSFLTVITETPHPWTRWLPLMLLLGVAIGCVAPALAASAVQHAPPAQVALAGALNSTARQIGAALGVAVLVAVQAMSTGIGSYRAGWITMAVFAATSGAISLLQPRPAAPAVGTVGA
jgi:MFS family permease